MRQSFIHTNRAGRITRGEAVFPEVLPVSNVGAYPNAQRLKC